MSWLIYGAYGYSGKLIAQHAKRMGYTPILAGRSAAKLKELGERMGLPWQAFSLDDEQALQRELADVKLLVNCAGPFSQTAKPLLQACLAARVHYLDITGEIDSFTYAHSLHEQAVEQGIVICPGVGFDVIPTDCIAARLNALVPNAVELKLGFDSRSRMSQGTAKTSIERMHLGGAVRRDGEIINVPLAYKTTTIDFGGGSKHAMTIPWGDVATAYYTTEIPNIEVYIPASPKLTKRLRRLNWVRWLLGFNRIQNWMKKKISQQPAGPDDDERKNNPTYVWGEIRDARGRIESLRVKVKNGYTLTAYGAVDVAQYVLHHKVSGGYYTPSRLYGASLIDKYIVD